MIRVALVEDYLPQIQRMEEILNQIQQEEQLNLQMVKVSLPYQRIPLTWPCWIFKWIKWMVWRQRLKFANKMKI